MQIEQKRIVILGGGFGGIKAALELCKSKFDVTLISDQKDFRYYPTLYHAATGGSLTASSIPLSEIFAGKEIKIVHASAQKIDRDKKTVVTTGSKSYKFDHLIIALGVTTNYFGIKGLKEYAYGIKSVEEATRLRNHLHKTLLDEGKPDVNYVVVGGGPTGVELAGALPGYLNHIMRRHDIKKHSLHIDLVEGSPRLVPRMPKSYSKAVAKRLRKLGVTLYLNQNVSAETADQLETGAHSIKSHTVVWTAGVTNHPFLKANNFILDDHGRVIVDDYLQAEDNIYVIGDNAATPYSGMAQTALYDGVVVAHNLKRMSGGKSPRKYQPKQPIYVIPVGHGWAIVLWGRLQISGRLGWWLRSAADFVGYHDYEPWWPAAKLWAAESAESDDCAECSKKR